MKLQHDALPVAQTSPVSQPSQFLVGQVKATEHPVLGKRALVSWQENSIQHERWLPVLRNLAIREGDQVLVSRVANLPEFIVTGILDSLTDEPPAHRSEGPVLRLAPDESLRILAPDGTPLLDIEATESGPQLRLLVEQNAIDLPGQFCLTADAIQLRARQGEMNLEASGDVKIRGEVIHAN